MYFFERMGVLKPLSQYCPITVLYYLHIHFIRFLYIIIPPPP